MLGLPISTFVVFAAVSLAICLLLAAWGIFYRVKDE